MKIRDLEVNKEKSKIVDGQAFLVVKEKNGLYIGTFNITNPGMVKNIQKMFLNKQPIDLEIFLEKPWIEEEVWDPPSLISNGELKRLKNGYQKKVSQNEP
jgi:hypothetical protein